MFWPVISFLVTGAFILLAVFWLGVLIGRNEQRKETASRIQDHVKRAERDEL